MNKYFIVLLVFFGYLSASPNNQLNSTDNFISGDQQSLATVMNAVNVIKGTFFQVDRDLLVDGPEPLSFTRYYDTGHLLHSKYGFGFGSQYPLRLRDIRAENKNCFVSLEVQEGSYLEFKGEKKKDFFQFSVNPKVFSQGLTNYSEMGMGAHTHAKNIEMIKNKEGWHVFFPDGRQRRYKAIPMIDDEFGAMLLYEKQPGGNITNFKQSPGILQTDCLCGFSKVCNTESTWKIPFNWITFKQTREGYVVTGSNGQSVTYKTSHERRKIKTKDQKISLQTYILEEVSASHLPTTRYEIDESGTIAGFCKIGKVIKPEGRVLQVSYNKKEKVEKLQAPLGKTDELLTAYTFDYKIGLTKVKDALGNQTLYHYRNRLDQIVRPDGVSQVFSWDPDEGLLLKREIKNSQGKVLRDVQYTYDSRGNITKETSLCSKYYTYSDDGFNLLTQEKDDFGLQILYTYKPGTNLLSKKETRHHGRVVETLLHDYNEFGVLIKTRQEDDFAVKITKIHPVSDPNHASFGKPAEIEEFSNQLLSLVKYCYNDHGFLTRKETYDANRLFCFAEEVQYDERDLVVEEVDALGQITLYDYDKNHNKVYEEKVGSGRKTYFRYDYMNRLIEKEEQEDEAVFVTKYDYDLLGNCIAIEDIFGNRTTFCYDHLSRLVETKFPQDTNGHFPSTRKNYDGLDRVVSSTDERGFETKYQYSAYDKPTQIFYPDGSVERFEYLKNGWLKAKWDAEGVKTEYSYNPEGLVIKEALYDKSDKLIEEVQREYRGNYLVSETDPMGIVTHYEYDSAGRKIKEKREERETRFSFDSLGRLFSKTCEDRVEITEYDALNRLIEKRVESTDGTLFEKETYSYDRNGNRTTVNTFVSENEAATAYVEYNPRGEPLLKIDPLGNQTTITYDYHFRNILGQRVLQKVTTDPNGGKTIETFDAHHRLISLEKDGYFENTLYDPAGNKIRLTAPKKYVVNWEYDQRGRLSKLTEESKTTTYSYFPTGRLKQKIKPDGVALDYTYIPNGLLDSLISSDNSVSYLFSYDANHNLVEMIDCLSNTAWKKGYNRHNELILDDKMAFSYDGLGRIATVAFPDATQIRYFYNANNLVAIQRGDYEECYSQFDLRGNPQIRSTNHTTISCEWDLLNRRISLDSPFYSETLSSFDGNGNLLKWDSNTYAYDSQDQLILENEHTYSYDLLHNRIKKDCQVFSVNELNQYVGEDYSYDLNGNLTRFGAYELRYDALDRLREIITPEARVFYSYDGIDRLISRGIEKNGEITTQTFLYQLDKEVGAINKNEIVELRILDPSRGPTLAVELDNKRLSVISDHIGSIRALVDEAELQNLYTYTAFGEQKVQKSTQDCPWGFNGRRQESEMGFLIFSKRLYHPGLGRWLTPDPLKFADGINLYAYVGNNPLVYEDPFGLFAFPTYISAPVFSPNSSFSQGFSIGATRGFFDPFGTIKNPSSLDFKIASNDSEGVSRHLMDRSLQFGEFSGAVAGITASTMGIIGLGKMGLSLGSHLLSKAGVNNLWRGFSPAVGKSIAKGSSTTSVRYSFDEKSKILFNSWDKGTFQNRMQSLRYHTHKHGKGRSYFEYTKDANIFFNQNIKQSKGVVLKKGGKGLMIKTEQEGKKIGGFWTEEGKIITFWD